MKFCKKCSTEKPLSDFYDSAARTDGKYPYCKVCHQAYMRNRYSTDPTVRTKRIANYAKRRVDDPEFIAANKRRSAEFYESIEGRARTLLTGARRRDANCSVTLEHIVQGIQRGHCPVTGIRFDLTTGHQALSGRSKSPYSPSLDRIDSRKGYTNENTRIVIWQYNMAKGELADYEILFICQQIVARNANAVA